MRVVAKLGVGLIALVVAIGLLGPAHAHAAGSATWTGGGTPGLWSDAANWGGTIPANGDDLIISSPPATMNDDLVLSVNSLTIGGPTTLSGNSLTVGATGISVSGAVAVAVADDLVIANPGTAVQAPSGGSLTLRGIIAGGGGVTTAGAGKVNLTGDNIYTGVTNVSAGQVEIDGSQPASDVTVQSGARLQGGGTVGSLTALGTATIDPLQETAGPPGEARCSRELDVVGDLTLGADTTLVVRTGDGCFPLNGDTWSKVFVTGDAHVDGHLTIRGDGLLGRDCLVSASGAITGTFIGQVDDSLIAFESNYVVGKIHYLSGQSPFLLMGCQASVVALDGQYWLTTTTVTSSANPSKAGEAVTFTATVSHVGSGATDAFGPQIYGKVQFAVDGQDAGVVDLDVDPVHDYRSTATLRRADLGVGSHSVSATYIGDDWYQCTSSSGGVASCSPVPHAVTARVIRSAATGSAQPQLSSVSSMVESVGDAVPVPEAGAKTRTMIDPTAGWLGIFAGLGFIGLSRRLSRRN